MIAFAGFTDKGLIRKINQDTIFMAAKDDIGLFCVADGMGGHYHGEMASGYVREALIEWWKAFDENRYNHDFGWILQAIRQSLEDANRRIFSEAEGQICGSTVVILFIYHDYYAVFYAGDSRIYRKKGFGFEQITTDEVWENQPDLNLSPKEIQNSPNAGKLMNAVGISDALRLTGFSDELNGRQLFVLCSDGLYKMSNKKMIRKLIRKASPDNLNEICAALKEEAYAGGGKDNVSVILVYTKE